MEMAAMVPMRSVRSDWSRPSTPFLSALAQAAFATKRFSRLVSSRGLNGLII